LKSLTLVPDITRKAAKPGKASRKDEQAYDNQAHATSDYPKTEQTIHNLSKLVTSL
jgi:hypothetical protein